MFDDERGRVQRSEEREMQGSIKGETEKSRQSEGACKENEKRVGKGWKSQVPWRSGWKVQKADEVRGEGQRKAVPRFSEGAAGDRNKSHDGTT